MRTLGKTHALSVSNSSHSSVTIGSDVNEQCNTVALVNGGATTVSLTFSAEASAPATVLPADGSPTLVTVTIPPNMITPWVWNVPRMPCSVTAIGSAAGPSIVYITPVQVP